MRVLEFETRALRPAAGGSSQLPGSWLPFQGKGADPSDSSPDRAMSWSTFKCVVLVQVVVPQLTPPHRILVAVFVHEVVHATDPSPTRWVQTYLCLIELEKPLGCHHFGFVYCIFTCENLKIQLLSMNFVVVVVLYCFVLFGRLFRMLLGMLMWMAMGSAFDFKIWVSWFVQQTMKLCGNYVRTKRKDMWTKWTRTTDIEAVANPKHLIVLVWGYAKWMPRTAAKVYHDMLRHWWHE